MAKGNPSREIDGKMRTVRELLAGRKYGIDYYQREYEWQTKQVSELLTDLIEKFLACYEEGHERTDVAYYAGYFLGSIIVSDRSGDKFIIDGQQRLTTLTLLLIFLYHELQDPHQKGQIADLIFSQKFGRRSFNLDIPERNTCMDALFTGKEYVPPDPTPSVENILGRYNDIRELFPDELKGQALPYFTDWLIEKVYFIEITTYSDEDAYAIFETMNDRGLALAPSDMLKGELLAGISPDRRTKAADAWNDRTQALRKVGKNELADAIKAWLRSQYAETIREHKRDAEPQDFERIGTAFHRWVRDNKECLGLRVSEDFTRFIEWDFVFYSRWYEQLRRASSTLTSGLESVYYNAEHNFTLQYSVLLAPLRPEDDEVTIRRKLRLVADYLDIVIHRRIWNFRAIDYSTMQYSIFRVIRDIRGRSVTELIAILTARLDDEVEPFSKNPVFRLHGTNGRQLHRILARMTDYVAIRSGLPSRYTEYAQRGRQGYEIEHIWANHPERHADEFSNPGEFEEYRNRIGALLLLPKSFNASYRDLPYSEKREHYYGQNLLAQSLHERAYDHNPGFARFVRESGLPFRPHTEFKKADLEARQELYVRLAEQIWSVDRIRAQTGDHR